MPDLLAAALLSAALIVGCVMLHYEGLHLLSRRAVLDGRRTVRWQLIPLMLGVIAIHLVEAGLFALGFWLGDRVLGIGSFTGARPVTPAGYFYFSAETMTTQGVGDVYPVGALRLLAALEPVAGLLLIGWSTSFTFLVMRRFWHLETARPVRTLPGLPVPAARRPRPGPP